jgi:hypothetical protein
MPAAGLTTWLELISITFLATAGFTVPHGRPICPSRTVTGNDAVNRPEVTETVVVPGLKAQNSPEDLERVGLPAASSSGNRDPGELGRTKSPIVGSELVNS